MKDPTKVLMLGPCLTQNGGMATVENLILKLSNQDVEISHIGTHDDGSVPHRAWIFFRAILAFLATLLKRQVDIIHIHVSEKGSVVRKGSMVMLARLFRKPVVMHTHGSRFHSFYQSLPSFLKKLVTFIFRRCDRVLVLSKSWQEFYVSDCKLSPDKVIVFPNPVDIPGDIPERAHADNVNFLFMGRLGERKGAFDLLQSFARLKPESRRRSSLTLAGDGQIEEAQALARDLNIADRVTFAGWVDAEARNHLLAAANVFILPSYNEGVPMAILEAMSWALPIISTPVGGIPEVVVPEENGLLSTPGNIEEISAAMERLVADEAFRIQCGVNAREKVKGLSIENYRQSLFSLYSELIAT